jgi:Ca2+/Na+ antiporter
MLRELIGYLVGVVFVIFFFFLYVGKGRGYREAVMNTYKLFLHVLLMKVIKSKRKKKNDLGQNMPKLIWASCKKARVQYENFY